MLTTWFDLFDERRWLALLLGVGAGGVVNFLFASRLVYRTAVGSRRHGNGG